jgi:hypothetical protein
VVGELNNREILLDAFFVARLKSGVLTEVLHIAVIFNININNNEPPYYSHCLTSRRACWNGLSLRALSVSNWSLLSNATRLPALRPSSCFSASRPRTERLMGNVLSAEFFHYLHSPKDLKFRSPFSPWLNMNRDWLRSESGLLTRMGSALTFSQSFASRRPRDSDHHNSQS